MYILTDDTGSQFDAMVYKDQAEANRRAEYLAREYKTDIQVCKVVPVSLFKTPLFPSRRDMPL